MPSPRIPALTPFIALIIAIPAILACAPSDADLDARIQQTVTAAVATAAAAAPTPALLTTPPDLSALYRQASPAVFYIDPTDGQHGAGWLLAPGSIVTAAHVVAGRDQVIIRQASNPTFVAVVAGRDDRRDVALLHYDVAAAQLPPGANPLPLGDATIDDIARNLLALGYSGSGVKREGAVGSPKANAGILSQITNFGPDSYGRNLEMDAAIDPGDSGGPVLNTAGQVVGMVRAAARRAASGGTVVGTFYAVHADEIRAALTEIKSPENPAPPQ